MPKEHKVELEYFCCAIQFCTVKKEYYRTPANNYMLQHN